EADSPTVAKGTVAQQTEPCEISLMSWMISFVNFLKPRAARTSIPLLSLRAFPGSPPANCLLDFDPAHQRVVFHGGELNHILTAGICIHHELLDDCLVLGSCGREDIEIGQHLRAVDAHVEYS